MFTCTCTAVSGASGERRSTIVIEGRATVEHAAEMYAELRGALDASDEIELDLRALEEADLSFVQLVLATQSTCAGSGKRFRISGEPTPVYEALLQQAGIDSDITGDRRAS